MTNRKTIPNWIIDEWKAGDFATTQVLDPLPVVPSNALSEWVEGWNSHKVATARDPACPFCKGIEGILPESPLTEAETFWHDLATSRAARIKALEEEIEARQLRAQTVSKSVSG